MTTQTTENTDKSCCAPTCCDEEIGQASHPSAAGQASHPSSGAQEVREIVKAGYAGVAESSSGCCGGTSSEKVATVIGYENADIEKFDDANLGLGCGNPVAHSTLRKGDRVLDLGSGAGFDAFIARDIVGEEGHVIGVDMTREMLVRARDNATKQGVSSNVEFREGTIEDLPVANDSVDVVISNCVVNLSPEKDRVFAEAHRVLKPGGRIVFSDILTTGPLPEAVKTHATALLGCIAGAATVEEYRDGLTAAGFLDVELTKTSGACVLAEWSEDPLARSLRDSVGEALMAEALSRVASYAIQARKE